MQLNKGLKAGSIPAAVSIFYYSPIQPKKMIKIKVGSKFERRTKRGVTHDLIVLHDVDSNQRILYNINGKVRQGAIILLYCHYVGEATKGEIEKYQNLLNQNK